VTEAIADGGDLPSLVSKLKEMERRRDAIRAEQAAAQPLPMPPRAVIDDRLAEWRRLLRESVPTGRAVLERLLVDRIVFTPVGADVRVRKDGTKDVKPVGYEFACATRYDRLFSGLVVHEGGDARDGAGRGRDPSGARLLPGRGRQRGLRRNLAPCYGGSGNEPKQDYLPNGGCA
jgi:hypothetical protein